MIKLCMWIVYRQKENKTNSVGKGRGQEDFLEEVVLKLLLER